MKNIIIFSLLLLAIGTKAQSLSASLVSSGGQSLASGDVSVELAVGQPVTGDIASAAVLISQGFLMPTSETVVTGLIEHEATVSVYPNPVTERLFIKADMDLSNLHVDLIDFAGRVVPVVQNRSEKIIELGLHDIAPAFYLLRMQNPSGQLKIVSIIKLNR